MSSIVSNQKSANHSIARTALRSLTPAMLALSEPERAAMLALLAAATCTPVDIVLLGVRGDDVECSSILDGVLGRGETLTSWKLGSGCEFVVTLLPREESL